MESTTPVRRQPLDIAKLHRAYLTRFASRRLRDTASIENVVRDTLEAARQEARGLEQRASLRPWLTGVLLRRIGEQLRRETRASAARPAQGATAQPSDDESRRTQALIERLIGSPESHPLDARPLRSAVAECLASLPVITVRLLTLHESMG